MADITLRIYGDARHATQTIQQLEANLRRLQAGAGTFTFQIDERGSRRAIKSLSGMLENFQSTMRSRISTAIISAVTQSTKEALNTMKAVDQQLTNIQKVSGKTSAEIQKIGDSAYKTASKFGVAADEYLEAVYTFQKAGLNDSAEQMAELATKTMLVGDTTASVASKFLIATNAAWDLQGNMERLSQVVDEADYINNNYATDLAKLSAGMPIVASTAANMNMTIEETLAVLGTITAKTQETGTKAATAWRALSMNLAKEVGTITDEEGEAIQVTEESIKSVTDALKKYGTASIQAAIDTGKVIDPMEAVEALAQAYKDGLLDDIELTNILMNVGGKLRTNQLTALVKDLASETSTYRDIMKNLPKAAGTADAEINTMLGSWNAKTQQLKNTWTEFVSNTIESDLAKDVVDVLKNIIELADNAVGRGTALAVSLGAIGSALGPIGAGVGALAGIAFNLYSIWRDNNREFEAATEALDKMNETFETQNEHLKDNDDKLEATALITQAYIDKLAKLDKGSDEYHDTLLRITELMPELKNYIDLENDTIDGGIDLLHKRADAWVENAKMAAYGASVEAKAAALANAEIAKAEAELKQSRAETELNTYNKRMQSLVAAIEFNTQKRDSTSDATEMAMYARMGVVLDEELAKVRILRDEAAASYKAQTEAIEGYDEAILTATQDLEDAEKAYDSLAQKADKQNKANTEGRLKQLSQGGNVDLTKLPVINGKELAEAGWAEAAEGAASIFAETFTNETGDLAVNLSPVMYDPMTGGHIVLTKEQLANYAKRLFSGDEDGAKIQIGAMFDGKNAEKEAKKAAEEIGKLVEENLTIAYDEFNRKNSYGGGTGGGRLNAPVRDDPSQRQKVDLSEPAEEVQQNAEQIQSALDGISAAYEAEREQVAQAQSNMVADSEAFVQDTAAAIENEASTAAGAAASAGTEIGLSFAKSIAQSDAVRESIASMVGVAKQFLSNLQAKGLVSWHGYSDGSWDDPSGVHHSAAAGTTDAPGGATLVNELGPELINDNGKVYIANGGNPAVVNLSKGAIVLTAKQTAMALSGASQVPKYGAAAGNGQLTISNGSSSASVPVYDEALAALGYGYRATDKYLKDLYDKYFPEAPQQGKGNGKGGGGSSTPGKTAAQIAKEAAEKRKKELEAAQKKLDDSLSNLDKQIKLALNQGDEKKAAQLYEKQQQLIADMVKKYQKAGYKDTSNEILDLLNKNYDIAGKQESLYKDKFDDLIDSLDANTDAEKKANTLAEKAQAVSDAQEALANAQKQRTVRIYNAATGQWEWIADEKQVKSAEENLKKAEQSYADEVKSQALEELKSMRDTISNLNDIVLGPALSTVATMGSDTSEFQAFAQALHAVYGVGSYLVGTQGSSKVLPTTDSHDTVYSFGDLVLTEEQASTMTLKQLAQQLQVLKLTS